MATGTQRTWIGCGNNEASNPNDWSPTGAPQPGNSLNMSAGTINISGDALAGDTLTIPYGFPAKKKRLTKGAQKRAKREARLVLSLKEYVWRSWRYHCMFPKPA
jgi:hypothetical protein